MIKYKIYISLCLYFLCHVAYTQTSVEDTVFVKEVVIDAKMYSNGNFVKWVPSDADLWFRGINHGYKLERKAGDDGSWELLADTIKPLPEPQFQKMLVKDATIDDYVAVQYASLYDYSNEENTALDPWTKSSIFQNKYFMAMVAAELNKDAALYGGLAYMDTNRKSSETYTYRVTLYDGNILSNEVAASFRQLPRLSIISDVEDYDLKLSWYKEWAAEHYSAYWIERKTTTQDWHRVNKLPYIITEDFENYHYQDSLTTKDTCLYRIIGIDNFGDEGPTSNEVKVAYTDVTPPPMPTNVKTEIAESGEITISWSRDKTKDTKYYTVGRSLSFEGPFVAIKDTLYDANSLSVTDMPIINRGKVFYVVYAFDSHGNYITSHPVSANIWDNTAPEPPTELAYTIDTTGMVTLTWKYPYEDDIMGFRIFGSYSKEHRFVNIEENWTSLEYKKKLRIKNIDERYYFKISCMDRSGNVSEFSDIIEIEIPDLKPPATTWIKELTSNKDGVFLSWAPSSSSDISYYEIRRKSSKNQEAYETITVDASKNSYTDTETEQSSTYYYSIACIDDADNVGETDMWRKIETKKILNRSGLTDMDSSYDKEANLVILRWRNSNKDIDKIRILRSVDGKRYTDFAYRSKLDLNWMDRKVRKNSTYHYKVVPIYVDGRHGIPQSFSVSTK